MALAPSDQRRVQQHQVVLSGQVVEGPGFPAKGLPQALGGRIVGEVQAGAFLINGHQQIAEVICL